MCTPNYILSGSLVWHRPVSLCVTQASPCVTQASPCVTQASPITWHRPVPVCVTQASLLCETGQWSQKGWEREFSPGLRALWRWLRKRRCVQSVVSSSIWNWYSRWSLPSPGVRCRGLLLTRQKIYFGEDQSGKAKGNGPRTQCSSNPISSDSFPLLFKWMSVLDVALEAWELSQRNLSGTLFIFLVQTWGKDPQCSRQPEGPRVALEEEEEVLSVTGSRDLFPQAVLKHIFVSSGLTRSARRQRNTMTVPANTSQITKRCISTLCFVLRHETTSIFIIKALIYMPLQECSVQFETNMWIFHFILWGMSRKTSDEWNH